MSASLVGSEMCIRDSLQPEKRRQRNACTGGPGRQCKSGQSMGESGTVSYTHLTLPTICSV
eukprot:15289040-Alexandrium_andersonii.AAC.1